MPPFVCSTTVVPGQGTERKCCPPKSGREEPGRHVYRPGSWLPPLGGQHLPSAPSPGTTVGDQTKGGIQQGGVEGSKRCIKQKPAYSRAGLAVTQLIKNGVIHACNHVLWDHVEHARPTCNMLRYFLPRQGSPCYCW